MPDKTLPKSKVTYEEAKNIISRHVVPISVCQHLSALESLGRMLAEDVVSDMYVPPLDCSAMDGYAVISSDICAASKDSPVVLEVIDEIPAGSMPRYTVEAGKASRIMTGAPVPEGADSVLMVEKTACEGKRLCVYKPTKKGENVRKSGEDLQKGSVVLRRGTLIRPAEVAILASVGKSMVPVIRKPRVSVLATGDELVEITKTPTGGKIRNSNSYMICSLLDKYGCQFIDMGIVKDDMDSLREAVKRGLLSDVLITTGGVSVGDYDFVKEVMEELGVQIIFNSIKVKPGKPTTFGVYKDCLVFGLPGYPVASFSSFELFVRPVILGLAGRGMHERRNIEAVIEHDFKKKTGRLQVVPAWTSYDGDACSVRIKGALGSGVLSSVANANSFIFCSPESSGYKAGDRVTVQLID